MKISKTKVVFVILTTLLLLSLTYIAIDIYTEMQRQDDIRIYSSGLRDGFAQAVIQIMQQASTCQEVPLFYNNRTINIIAIECLVKKDEYKK